MGKDNIFREEVRTEILMEFNEIHIGFRPKSFVDRIAVYKAANNFIPLMVNIRQTIDEKAIEGSK